MLLKVRLPASIPQIPPMPRMALSLSDVDLTLSALPSSSTILLSMVAVFVLLSFVRAFFIGFREHLAFVKGRKAQQVPKFNSSTSASSSPSSSEKSNSTPRVQMEQRPTSSWLWGLIKWDTLPAFPLAPSLQHAHVSAGIGRGVGVGMSEKQGWFQPQAQQAALQGPVLTTRRPGGPAFERPLPTLYQSEVPVSMAKMIMSRHTFRRPSSRPPPARQASVQIQRRSPSAPLLPQPVVNPILIPTASSSLARPLSPPSRSPSPPSPSNSSRSSGSRTPSPTSSSSSRSPTRSRSPSPTSPSLEELLELHSRSSGQARESIV